MFISVKSTNNMTLRNMEKKNITGLRLPNLVDTLSEIYPMIGLKTAFHMEPMATMVPAAAGGILATVVRKNSRNVPTIPYEIASPREAMPYPSFSRKVVFAIHVSFPDESRSPGAASCIDRF